MSYLGIELGSTRIKAVVIGEDYTPMFSGDYTWKSSFTDGVWTYELSEAWAGLKVALSALPDKSCIEYAGISGMMHGYLAFDKDWNLLVPFRTWQNTMTAQAAEKLTGLFGFNVPQRWSIAHLYQAVLNGEEHIPKVAHITTLAGYVHYMLTGINAVGVGEASGIFPIDSEKCGYDEQMLEKFERLTAEQPWNIRDVLPKVLSAGENAGRLTERGAELMGGLLPVGIPFCPPEGDAGTGMTATNAVAVRTGNVSAGTSIFSMVVLEKPLSHVYQEIDMVTTPSGKPVAMVHCNNCTGDMNVWAELIREVVELFGGSVSTGELFTRIYQKSLEGQADCDGITVYNYLAGEGITHLDEGRPLVVRQPSSRFTLANFLRAQLYTTVATLAYGMEILKKEQVNIDRLMGHGGLFKTPLVGQRYLAAACGAPVTCMETAGEGGPYGIALLAAYAAYGQGTLEAFLDEKVFAGCKSGTLYPNSEDEKGFEIYLKRFVSGLRVESTAIEAL